MTERPITDFVKPGMSSLEGQRGARAWLATMGIDTPEPNTPDCAGCVWWNGGERREGYCRRNAPTLIQTESGAETLWPLTKAGDVCGEHVPAA